MIDTMNEERTLEKLHILDREYRRLLRVIALLQWDQETCLPHDGVKDRAEQLAVLQGIAHSRITDPAVGTLLAELGSSRENPQGDTKLSGLEQDFIRVLRREYDRAVALPADFVSAAARAEGLSQAAWVKARSTSDFASFMPHLAAMVDIARKKAQYWGCGDRAYDALLDLHETGMDAAKLEALFDPLAEKLKELVKRIVNCSTQPERIFQDKTFDTEVQHRFGCALMDYMGFDQKRGRLDISAHPFTTTLGTDDVRLTTRYLEKTPVSGILSTLHELGHAFYELGLPSALRGTVLGDGSSMGIHESQSRLWENVIGRSRAFWTGLFPLLCSYFPQELGNITLDSFVRDLNRVECSPIRIEADELSYNLHIILRFKLEQRLFSGELPVDKLPQAWNSLMKELLNVDVEDDRHGVLQDVHWSMGSFGYFPSYTLGNLYGLEFWKKLNADIPNIEEYIVKAQFQKIRDWLSDTVYMWGKRLCPQKLLKKITGGALKADSFMEYIEKKCTELYGL